MLETDPSIHLLPDHTINQIAAGEVIENPASVVKELVENSIDAGSNLIVIDIIGGGFHSISISDNGCGIGKSNLELAFVRHATSKLQQIGDMEHLHSMGFRGEALASIGSVAKVKLTSKSKFDDESGYYIECFGGKVSKVAAKARANGTTLIVDSIFYNVPARSSFQKGSSASTREIIKLVTKLALAHPQCGIKLICDGEERIEVPYLEEMEFAKALSQKVETLMGKEVYESLIPINVSRSDRQIVGFLGPPSSARKTRLGQYLFINHRPVFSPVISSAIYDAFGTRLSSNEHPVFILHLQLPADIQDVNVHPQKKEIRLKSKTSIYSWIVRSIENAFGRVEQITGNETAIDTFASPIQPVYDTSFTPSSNAWQAESFSSFVGEVAVAAAPAPASCQERLIEEKEMPLMVLGRYKMWAFLEKKSLWKSFAPPYWDKNVESEAMLIFDLKRAMSRIDFDKLVLDLEKGAGDRQALLLPKTLTYPAHEVGLIEKHLGSIKELGIGLRAFGPGGFVVEAVHPQIKENELESLVLELSSALESSVKSEEKKRRESVALLMLGYMKEPMIGRLDVEIRYIFNALMKTASPYYCPRGQAVFGLIGESKFEKLLS